MHRVLELRPQLLHLAVQIRPQLLHLEAKLRAEQRKVRLRRDVTPAQRRKTLRNSLTKSGGFGAPQEAVLDAMDAAGIDPGRRPQTLGIEEFGLLAREIRSRI